MRTPLEGWPPPGANRLRDVEDPARRGDEDVSPGEWLVAPATSETAFFIGGGQTKVAQPSTYRVIAGLDSSRDDRLLGEPEPVREVLVEVAVAVARTAVADSVAGAQRGGVGLIGRVGVERRRRVVLDVEVRASAGLAGVVSDVVDAGLLGEPRRLVRLELLRALDDLRAESGEGRVARGGVGAGGPHGRGEGAVGRGLARREPLLLLQRHEDDLRRDAARDLGAVDHLGHLHRAALDRGTDEVAGRLRRHRGA